MADKNDEIATPLEYLLSGHFRGITEQPDSARSNGMDSSSPNGINVPN